MPFQGYPKAIVSKQTALRATISFTDEADFTEEVWAKCADSTYGVCTFLELEHLMFSYNDRNGNPVDLQKRKQELGATIWHYVFVSEAISQELETMKALQLRAAAPPPTLL